MRVVGYFPNRWSEGETGMRPEDIDTRLCTNLVYAFACLDPESLTIKESNTETDIENGFYQQVTNLPRVRVSLGLGGWTDTADGSYSRMMSSDESRANFVQTTVEFIERHGFTGLELQLPNPTQEESADKEGFTSLVRELQLEFRYRGWFLSAAISPRPDIISRDYCSEALNELNWVSVMTYDYHSQADGITGHVSPYSSVKETIKHLLSMGVESRKLLLGVPLYGRSYQLKDRGFVRMGEAALGPGQAGRHTHQEGVLSLLEIYENIKKEGWNVSHEKKYGSYAFKKDQWVSFVSSEDLKKRTDLVRKYQLGGVMVCDISMDDFRGSISQNRNPKLVQIYNV